MVNSIPSSFIRRSPRSFINKKKFIEPLGKVEQHLKHKRNAIRKRLLVVEENKKKLVYKKNKVLRYGRRKHLRKSKRSFIKAKRLAKRYARQTEKRTSEKYLNRVKYKLTKANANISKISFGALSLKLTRRNFFITLSRMGPDRYKIKKKKRYGRFGVKKKPKRIRVKLNPKQKVLLHKSSGQLKIYKGRGKVAAVAKKALAKTFIKKLQKSTLRIIDLYIISEMNRSYMPIIAGLASKAIVFRTINRLMRRSHGYVRRKKERRI